MIGAAAGMLVDVERTAPVLTRSTVIGPLVLDAVSVLAFVAIGRDSHDEGTGLGDLVTIAAPFLIGVLVGVALVLARRGDLRSLRAGATVLAATVTVGMVLRHWAWDRGTAASFVVVTVVFLALAFLGWRALWGAMGRRRGYSRSVRVRRT